MVRNFVTATIAGILCLSNLCLAGEYDRVVNLIYRDDSGKNLLGKTDVQLQEALEQVTNGITSLNPLFLNVNSSSITEYSNMIQWAQENNITVFPAVGGQPHYPGVTLDNEQNRDIARGYRTFTSRIRIENPSGFWQNNHTDLTDFIDYCIDLGFENIMLNPWPFNMMGSTALVQFDERQMQYLQSAFQNVNATDQTHPADNTWLLNMELVERLVAIQPNISIVVNYEAPLAHEELAQLESEHQGASLQIFNTTIHQLESSTYSSRLYWTPPFSQNYDPLDFDPQTWPWIVNVLDQWQS